MLWLPFFGSWPEQVWDCANEYKPLLMAPFALPSWRAIISHRGMLSFFHHQGEAQTLWSKDEVLVSTPTKNYTAYGLGDMLKDLGWGRLVQEFDALQVSFLSATDRLVT